MNKTEHEIAAEILKRYEMWAPTGPCPIVPPNCTDNPGWVETRSDVPSQPWITGIDSPIVIGLIVFVVGNNARCSLQAVVAVSLLCGSVRCGQCCCMRLPWPQLHEVI